jgi:hypothetical protein
MQSLEQIDPAFHRVDGNTDFIGETRIDQLMPRAFGENVGERFQQAEGFDLRDIADILVRQLFVPQRAPATGKAHIAAQKRFREAAMVPQCLPFSLDHRTRRINDIRRQPSADGGRSDPAKRGRKGAAWRSWDKYFHRDHFTPERRMVRLRSVITHVP